MFAKAFTHGPRKRPAAVFTNKHYKEQWYWYKTLKYAKFNPHKRKLIVLLLTDFKISNMEWLFLKMIVF